MLSGTHVEATLVSISSTASRASPRCCWAACRWVVSRWYAREINTVLIPEMNVVASRKKVTAHMAAGSAPRPFSCEFHEGGLLGNYWAVLEKCAEVVRQILGRCIAIGRILFDRLEDDRFQILRDVGVDLPRRARFVEGDLSQQLLAVVAGEGGLEGEQLVERDAERIDVAAVVDDHALGEGLLGAHVAQRAEDVAGHRHAGVLLRCGRGRSR